MYKMRNVIPNYRTRIRATFFNDTQDVNDPIARVCVCVCVCVGGGGGGGGGASGHARRKKIDYAHDLRGYIFQKRLLA